MEIISRSQAQEKGLRHYFTGKPCKHGHVGRRYVCDRRCLSCKALSLNKWRGNPKNREAEKKQQAQYKSERRSHLNFMQAVYRENNRESIRRSQAEGRIKDKTRWVRYKYKNLEAFKKRRNDRERYRTKHDPNYKAARYCRVMVRRLIGITGQKKDNASPDILGYSSQDFRAHIERHFTSDMRWENHGDVWQIDHIIPVMEMIRLGITDPKKINALSNLMPEYKGVNMAKGDRFALTSKPLI